MADRIKNGAARLCGATGGGERMSPSDNRTHPLYSTHPVALQIHKRGKSCIVGKIVTARPLNERVLAIAYKARILPCVVSMPVVAVNYAIAAGVRRWIVRDDTNGLCFAIDLEKLQRTGWLQSSFGIAEHFARIADFERVAWQDWDYVRQTVRLDAEAEPEAEQLQLALEGGGR